MQTNRTHPDVPTTTAEPVLVVAWIGIVTCLREAGLGIADLRRFTELLRSEVGQDDRVAFLRRRRAELVEQADRIRTAVRVLDDKIAHYSTHA